MNWIFNRIKSGKRNDEQP